MNLLWAIASGEEIELPSTGLAEVGGQVFIKNTTSSEMGTISSKVWSVLENLTEEANMLGQILFQIARSSPSSAAGASNSLDSSLGTQPIPSEVVDGASNSPRPRRGGLAALKSSLMRTLALLTQTQPSVDSVNGPQESPSVMSTDEEIDEMFVVITEAMEAKEWDKVKYILDDMILLINTDTGGQAEFLDLHASLVQGPSFNLLFRRLVDELDSQFEVYYTNKQGVSTEKEDSIMTVEEVLLQALASIAAFSGAFHDGEGTPSEEAGDAASKPVYSKCKVMFVGTFRDLVSEDAFEAKDRLLQQRIKETEFYDKGIIEFASEDRLMLAADNMSGDVGEIDQIRRVLERGASRRSPSRHPGWC